MKLNEIVDTQIKRVRTRQGNSRTVSDRLDQKRDKPNVIGTGDFARVEKHKNLPPNTVVKYGNSHGNAEDDGYVNWLNQVTKDKRAASNPYLPRIYKVQFVDDDQFIVFMEELEDFDTLSNAELAAIGRRAFGNIEMLKTLIDFAPKHMVEFYQDNIVKYGRIKDEDFRTLRLKTNEEEFIKAAFPKLLENIIHDVVDPNIVKDPQLKEALQYVADAPRGSLDLHLGNVMVRRGPYGAQLVITDPLS